MATQATDLKKYEVDFDELTDGSVGGDGIVDRLMKMVNMQINEQYNKGRINTNTFSEVYLGSIQSSIAQGVQVLLQKDEAALKAALIEAQVRKADKDIELADVQIEIAEVQKDKTLAEIDQINQDIAFSKKKELNLEAERKQTEAQTALILIQQQAATKELQLVDKQIEKADADIRMMEQEILASQERILTMQKERAQIEAQTSLTLTQKDLAVKELEVMDSNILQAEKQVELMDAELDRQPLIHDKMEKDNDLIDQQILNMKEQVLASKKQVERIESEIALMEQKKVSELAQTTDINTGILGAQRKLYDQQRKGFAIDANVKQSKVISDFYTINKANDSGFDSPSNVTSGSETVINEMLKFHSTT